MRYYLPAHFLHHFSEQNENKSTSRRSLEQHLNVIMIIIFSQLYCDRIPTVCLCPITDICVSRLRSQDNLDRSRSTKMIIVQYVHAPETSDSIGCLGR
jgi:hypothetical protein